MTIKKKYGTTRAESIVYIIMTSLNKIKNILSPYIELMRLNSSSIMFLALFPAWSSIIIVSDYFLQTIFYMILFLVGALVMRSAGCIINDIFDRKIDKEVERTASRPLVKETISLKKSFILLTYLLVIGLIILFFTNFMTIVIGILLLVMTIIYPLTKRFFIWPQLVLGLTFNLGILMGSTVITGSIKLSALLLYIGCVMWTIAYDTIYACQDKIDDIRIGIHSTALYFGSNIRNSLKKIYFITITMWLCSAITASLSYSFYFIFLLVMIAFFYQYKKTDFDNSEKCMYVFRGNVYVGFFLFLSFLFGKYC